MSDFLLKIPEDVEPVCEETIGAADPVAVRMHGIMAKLLAAHKLPERRTEQRCPYPYLVHLIPVSDHSLEAIDDPVIGVGRNISEHGLVFFHNVPLPHRFAIVSLEMPDSPRWNGFLVDLRWCRFIRFGWYESGGHLIQCVPSPLGNWDRDE